MEILLISFFCWLGSIENSQPFGATFSNALAKPIVGGAIVGIILGKPVEGILMGTTIQAMYLGNVVIGGVAAADMTFVAYPSIALALMAGSDADVAMSIAAIVGILGSALFTLWEAFCSVFYTLGDKAINEGNISKMKFIYTVLPPVADFIFRGGLTFVVLYLGNEYAATILNAIPQMILDIAGVLGGMLPAVGMSILLAYTLKDIKMTVWFIVGVMAISLGGFNTIAVAVLGACLAVIYYMLKPDEHMSVNDNVEEEEF